MSKDDPVNDRFQVTDRRFWVENEGLIDRVQPKEQRYPTVVEELQARTELAERKLKEKIEALERENESYRERLSRDMERRLAEEKFQLFRELFEIVDNFERALELSSQAMEREGHARGSGLSQLVEGVRLNLDLLMSRLRKWGIEPVEVVGHRFDPHVAEAVGVSEVSDPERDQEVLEELQRGYRFGDHLIRPARVRVGHFKSVDTQSGVRSES